MKAMLDDIERRMPGRKDTMIRALGNVRPSHLLDRKLFDFAALALDAGGGTAKMPMRFDDRDIGWLAGVLADAARRRDHAALPPAGRRRRAPEDIGGRPRDRGGRQRRAGHHRGDRRALPGALVVGEEACEIDAALLPRLGEAELAFVIDPVDGTFNFASGVPLFGVMLAVVQDGETVAGIIHDPVGKDFLIGARGARAAIS